ncbi:MAG: hypothetical protein ACRD9R_17585 [Pyrinomonadaceae bacterium]
MELPVLQELVATGGKDDVRFLYARLVAYFPQLSGERSTSIVDGDVRRWRRQVQRAGLALAQKRELERRRGIWKITSQGLRRVEEEAPSFSFDEVSAPGVDESAPLSHARIQQMLVEVGHALGYHAETEYEYIDVVWRAGEDSPRLSHAFEVQRKGNVDAALAKLKRAYDAQRSKPFLVVASERDTNRAHEQLSEARVGAFHEIGRVTTVLSFEQLSKLHRSLTSVEDLLAKLFD